MVKNEIRQNVLAMRSSLSEMMCTVLSNTIYDNLRQVLAYQSASTVFCYASYRNEADTKEIIDGALMEGKRVALPCSYTKDGVPHMEFYEIRSSADLVEGYKGILEPDRRKMSVKKADFFPNVVIVPMVAFDANLNRIGYGKGFYDHYFNSHDVGIKIGIAYGFQQVNMIPADVNDVRMDVIVTENGAIYGQ
ncbi:MAG: 5-formyltetrahydrofolate cyclo-ligase [Lachnospiraceae bacterium]|nr:5-formyltetrahydrofolate cyclo-ligase [Lachnospiraceae bacterium]